RPQRKQGAAELLLGQPEEKICLILGKIGRPLHQPATTLVIVLDTRVMAGGEQIGANLASRDQQLVELQVVVAKAARNRRAAGEIFLHERLHNVALETLFLVDDVIRDADGLGDTASVVNVVERAATTLD